MSIKFNILFVVLASTFTFSTFLEPYPFSWLVKILPLLTLIFVVYIHIKSKRDVIFLVGLVFSAIGDVILDLNRAGGFVFGLGAFLIAHLFYLSFLWPVTKRKMPGVLFYVIYGMIMLQLIIPGLGKLLLPVIIYMSVLLLMGIFTLVSRKSNFWLVLGGLFFVISDSVIGVNKFYASVPYSHLIIMITYYLAQYSLTKGVLKSSF